MLERFSGFGDFYTEPVRIESNEDENVMDRIGDVYVVQRIEDDGMYGSYNLPVKTTQYLTLGELYIDLVSEHGHPVMNEVSKENGRVIHLKFKCGTYYIAIVS